MPITENFRYILLPVDIIISVIGKIIFKISPLVVLNTNFLGVIGILMPLVYYYFLAHIIVAVYDFFKKGKKSNIVFWNSDNRRALKNFLSTRNIWKNAKQYSIDVFLKIYFGFLVIDAVIPYFSLIYFPPREIFGIWDIINFSILAVAVIGLFSFVWKKRIFTRKFWKIYFFVFLIWNIIFLCFVPMPQIIIAQTVGSGQSRWFMVLYIALSRIPLYGSLFFYTFKENIWKNYL